MPIYEYECTSCFCRFELKRNFSDSAEANCPHCNNSARRLFSPVPIIFKGSGFYVTDNRKNKQNDSIDKMDSDKPESIDRKEKSPKEDKDKIRS